MVLFRTSFVLLSLFLATVRSVDSWAGTHVITPCQYMMSIFDPTFLKQVNGDHKVGLKIPPQNTFHKDSFDLYLTTDGIEVTLTNPKDQGAEVAIATKLFPELMARWGFYFRIVNGKQMLHGPGTKALNQKAHELSGTALGKSFRWIDGFDNKNEETRLANDLVYLKLLSQGKIWLGTTDRPFMHDRFEEHMIAVLLMPSEVGWAFQKRLQFVFGLKNIFPDSEFVQKIFARETDELGKLWEDETANIGTAIAGSNADFDILLADDSKALAGYKRLSGNSSSDGLLSELSEDFKKAGIEVTKEQKTQLKNLTLRTEFRPTSTERIRRQIINQFIYAGIPVPQYGH